MKDEYDFIVIGGGSGGYAAAVTAARLGLEVALVEGAEQMGGLCILRGCMPSKAVIESANRFEAMRRAREYGLRAEQAGVHMDEVIARKQRLIDEFADHRGMQLAAGPFDLIRGWAKFIDAHTVEVTGYEAPRRVRAKAFLIATGSELKHVDVPGLCETGFLDSDEVLESTALPKSVIVLGGGAIAMEFTHYYAALGCQVTVIQRSQQVLREMDGDVATAVSDALRERGVKFHLGTELIRVEKTGGGKRAVFRCEGGEMSVEAEEIVYALGRAASLGRLAPEAAGLVVDHGRLCMGAHQQTDVPHIFAAGDAVGPHEVVHLAIAQGELAARNAARLIRGSAEPLEEMDYRLKLFVVFTEPQVAVLGFSERELMTAGAPYAVGRHPFSDLGKAIVRGETAGFVKLMASTPNGEILGAAAVGPEAGELIHELSAAMYLHATAEDLLRIPHYHPTLSEIWTYPAEELISP